MTNGFDREGTVIYKLGQIEGKLDAISLLFATHVAQDAVFKKELSDRVSSLEKSRTWVLGAVAAISLAITSASQFIWKAVGA